MKKLMCVVLAIMCVFALAACAKECEHEYEVANTREPGCESCGVREYSCKKCGDSKSEKYGNPVGHEMENGEFEQKRSGDLFYTRDVEVCTRCEHTEYGEWESKGDIYEYAAIQGVGQWLLADGFKVLDVSNAEVQYDDEHDCYMVIGHYSDSFATGSLGMNNTVGAAAEFVSELYSYSDNENIGGVILAGENFYVHTFVVQENGECVLLEKQIN